MKNIFIIKSIGTFAIFGLMTLFAANCNKGQKDLKSIKIAGNYELATLAGGCFWCIEAPFEKLDGIYSVISGYAGGKEKKPTYGEVSSGNTGHREAVQITFNPEIISYSEILDVFWKQFDPTDEGGSFYDRGSQYTSAIFYHTKSQEEIAKGSKKNLDEANLFAVPIVTKVENFSSFYPAENYHQDYYKKNPEDYKAYRKASGRDDFIKKYWEVPSAKRYPKIPEDELKNKLTKLQFKVTKENGTEEAFNNEYWDNKESGIYVCIISGAPLFSSSEKYRSGTGWPSFKKPIDVRMLLKPVDYTMGMSRIEVRSKYGDAHLGHVFYDGPKPTNLRYCINSAALKFVPKEEMKAEGYEKYLWLLE